MATTPLTTEKQKEKWSEAWTRIQSGEKLWTSGEAVGSSPALLSFLSTHLFPPSSPSSSSPKPHIFVPLCGDFSFVHLAWSEGYTVSALEFVPEAVKRLRERFEGGEGAWVVSECVGGKKWVYEKGRVVVYEADFFQENEELVGKIDVVVDKDAFGAIAKGQRPNYVDLITKYLKKGGVMVCETKEKFVDREKGPPFHLLEGEMREEWEREGGGLVYEEFLGSLYEWPNKEYRQVAHRLKKA